MSERPATFYQVPFGYYRIVPIKDSLVVRIVVAEPAVTTEGLHAVDVQVVRNIRLPDQRQTYTAAWAATKTSTRPHSRSQRASSAALTACLRCAFASTMRLTMPNKSKVLRGAGLSHRAREVAGGTDGSRTCMGVFLSSGFLFVAGSLFGAERPFLVPSPAIRFAERAEGVKGPKC